ncbi:MAG: hypothetical protein KGD59_06775 [Candidatus Heimdallarchaeota archaeon]|nr:hypothetical protein [Candidatus Heimdallarchaeota archaeon]MBY8994238.1 hypothetical protein [Candidatus Heimdallarchaeota archaeon]
MISIPEIDKTDKGLIILVIFGIVFTSFAWVGDIASWIYLGNGFTIDVILLVVAIILTIGTVFIRSKVKKGKSSAISEEEELIEQLDEIKEDEEITLTDKIFTCSSCGVNMSLSDESCPSCESPKPVCIVCLSDLKEKDTIVKLTCCSSYAHKEHIDNWVSVKGHCPKCHKEIQDTHQNNLLM